MDGPYSELNISPQLPAIVDVEASGLGTHGFPIEIGVVLPNGSRFCRLIKPFSDWTFWDDEAESVHGITREQLRSHGIDGVQVCHELNQFVGLQTLYSDAWVVDKPWLLQLFYRANVNMRFSVSSVELLLKEEQLNHWDNDKAYVLRRSGLKRHRASTDACIIQLTFERCVQRLTSAS